jgi:hypothetical protein
VHCASYEAWKPLYASDPFFAEIWVVVQHPTEVNQIPFMDYTIRYGWLYKLNQLCVPTSEDHLTLIKEAHASSYGGHFGSLKIVSTLATTFILAFYDSSSGAFHLCLCIV